MRRGIALLGFVVAVATAAVAALFVGHGPSTASASSHSEAPLISQDPRADNTDLYAFVSPNDTNTVTIIANYIPLEAPASGPNFYSFDDSALYQIGIDQNGDGHADARGRRSPPRPASPRLSRSGSASGRGPAPPPTRSPRYWPSRAPSSSSSRATAWSPSRRTARLPSR